MVIETQLKFNAQMFQCDFGHVSCILVLAAKAVLWQVHIVSALQSACMFERMGM